MAAGPGGYQSVWILLVVCVGATRAQSYGELRLTRGSLSSSSYTSGRLEIYINGRWGTVCDDGWTTANTAVACRQLGFAGSSSTRWRTSTSAGFGTASSSQTIWLDNVNCQSSSLRHILSCRHNGIGIENCAHSEDVAIYCSLDRLTDFPNRLDVRLVNGSYISQGRVEVYCGGQWGTICEVDDNFGQQEGNAICQQLGYTHASSINTLTIFPAAPLAQPIWLGSAFSCTSTATNISSCTSTSQCGFSDENGSRSCSHSSDVVVQCDYSSTNTYGELRLVQGTSTDTTLMSGRLEIFLDGEWGTICDDFWGDTEADVACRQLGYSRATNYGDAVSLGYGQGTGRIFLDNVNCFTSSSTLISCSHNGIGVHNCQHSEDIAVVCTTASASSIAGIVIGCVIGGIFLLIICSVIILLCKRKLSYSRTARPQTTATTPAAPYPTQTTVTTTAGTAYPSTGASPYPPQPPPQPGAYPAQLTAYPAKGQDPPPPYPGQPIELQPTAPQPGYPEQPAPYHTQGTGLAYPAAPYATDPTQLSPYPTQPSPYPSPSAPYPTQPAPYPTQPAPYPTEPARYQVPAPVHPYPTDPTQPAPYPTQPASHPQKQ